MRIEAGFALKSGITKLPKIGSQVDLGMIFENALVLQFSMQSELCAIWYSPVWYI